MAQDIDFQDLANHALRYITDLVPSWLPGGKFQGGEWVCGDLRGGPGDSMRVNMSSGMWADFATDDKGGDLISLYACINRVKQIDAAKALIEMTNYRNPTVPEYVPPKKIEKKAPRFAITKPPADVVPDMTHFKHGKPQRTWTYTDVDGSPMFYIARYQKQGQGKEFAPWCWDANSKRFVMKSWPVPRPLYNWHKLTKRKDSPVLIVEGEKAAEGAELLGAEKNYVVTTWPNGSKSWRNVEWSPLYGRKILIWPDADQPGIDCANSIAEYLTANGCQAVKIIQPDREDGYDAWDAYHDEMSWPQVIEWAKKKVFIWEPPEKPLPEEPVQEAEIVEDEEPEPSRREDDTPVPTKAEMKSLDEYGVALNGKGKPHQNIANIAKIFTNAPIFKGHFWYDEFDYRSYTSVFGKPHEVTDADVLRITQILQETWGVPTISSSLIHEAVTLVAHLNPRHSVRDWVKKQKWDGTERIETFFPDYFGADKNDYTVAVSRNFWVGMLARVFNPGCKNDYMVVLEGPQGVGKSMALSSIGGQWHTESTEAFGSKDFYQGLHGKMLVEIAELDSFSKSEVTRVKQVVTARYDRFRASYGRTASDYPRQCIFVGTTNESGYLRDATGARRFWPIKCTNIKIDQLNHDRAQLYAEALKLFEAGNHWHIVPIDLAQAEQEERYSHDELEITVVEYLEGKRHVIMRDMAREALDLDSARFDKRMQIRLAAILRRLEWTPRNEYVNGKKTRIWAHKDTPTMFDQTLSPDGDDGAGFSD